LASSVRKNAGSPIIAAKRMSSVGRSVWVNRVSCATPASPPRNRRESRMAENCFIHFNWVKSRLGLYCITKQKGELRKFPCTASKPYAMVFPIMYTGDKTCDETDERYRSVMNSLTTNPNPASRSIISDPAIPPGPRNCRCTHAQPRKSHCLLHQLRAQLVTVLLYRLYDEQRRHRLCRGLGRKLHPHYELRRDIRI
jgi:hypothetical protein